MNVEAAEHKDREWRREINDVGFLVSTSMHKLDIDWINKAFDSKDMHWAKSLPKEQISTMLSQSLTLGLYRVLSEQPFKHKDGLSSGLELFPTNGADTSDEHLQQIGMARFITDHVTFAYLTDVYLQDDHRGLDLGKWLVECCQEVMQGMPALRRGMLLTSSDVGKRFYSRELGFYDVEEERDYMICMTRRAYKLSNE